ncbi:MAG: hypothetical protein Q8M02_11045 [Candidatus Didemnitutus sp.]|nr:hypothetical protein [Candidatus Didemnitutus sp.]
MPHFDIRKSKFASFDIRSSTFDIRSVPFCLWFLAKNKNADAKRGFRDHPQPFNSLEFEGIKNEAGRNSFFLSAKKWGELTGAKGLIALPPQPATSIR